jgi:hypothetical protein
MQGGVPPPGLGPTPHPLNAGHSLRVVAVFNELP